MRNAEHNFSNDHGYEFVSYIYGELESSARKAFESHLAVCDECAMEMASYSDARLGVMEWRREDFDHLETPAIIVPWVSEKEAAKVVPAGLVTRFVEAINAFPVFAKIGTGLAAAVLAIGAFYFAVQTTGTQPNDVAAKKSPETQPVVGDALPHDNFVLPSVSANDDNAVPEDIKSVSGKHQIVRRPGTVARISNQRLIRRNELATTNPAPATTTLTKKAPRLTSVEEDEDRSLRLADLFAQIGSSKKE